MNRQQRRAQKKAAQLIETERRLSPTGQRLARMEKNGITVRDLEKEYGKGYRKAHTEITAFQMRMFYCATALALHELYGFGETRLLRTLDRIQEIMTDEICTADIIERLKRETGLDVKEEGYDN